MMIGTTKLCILIAVEWPPKLCEKSKAVVHFLENSTVDSDEINCVASTCGPLKLLLNYFVLVIFKRKNADVI